MKTTGDPRSVTLQHYRLVRQFVPVVSDWGEMPCQMLRHLLDAADHSPFEVPLSESGLHFAAYPLPFLRAHLLVNSAVGNDLHVPVREQQVN